MTEIIAVNAWQLLTGSCFSRFHWTYSLNSSGNQETTMKTRASTALELATFCSILAGFSFNCLAFLVAQIVKWFCLVLAGGSLLADSFHLLLILSPDLSKFRLLVCDYVIENIHDALQFRHLQPRVRDSRRRLTNFLIHWLLFFCWWMQENQRPVAFVDKPCQIFRCFMRPWALSCSLLGTVSPVAHCASFLAHDVIRALIIISCDRDQWRFSHPTWGVSVSFALASSCNLLTCQCDHRNHFMIRCVVVVTCSRG